MKDELRFEIPNGYITFRMKFFLTGAGRRSIRKMLKMLRGSEHEEEWVPEIRNWGQGQKEWEHLQQRNLAEEYAREKDKLASLQNYYEQMKSPCYPAYTTDKEKLEEARKNVSYCRKSCHGILAEIRESQRAEKRYQGILDDARKIFEGVKGCQKK